MRRTLYISLAVVVSTLPLTANALLPGELHAASTASQSGKTGQEPPKSALRDAPPDTTPYTRSAVADDYAPGGVKALTPDLFVRDIVVSNTDANLTNTDTFNDGEPSIAINPSNTNEIVIQAFSGGWGTTAPLWHSTDGGNMWSKQFTIPVPPGVPSATGCPCDQAPDYGRSNLLSSTFLTADVYSGTTNNPANSASWNWLLSGGNAVRTNSAGVGNVDQPWLLVNRDTVTASQDNVIVAYDDFNGAPDMRVGVALGSNPPNFVRDNQSGSSGGGFVNPGHRLAADPRNGWIYSLFQQRSGGDANQHAINYLLNRSTDGGQTWTLNGSGAGIVVVNANSTQGFAPSTTFDGMGNCTSDNAFKFGTVNALFGGVDHAAVDPSNGDVYYAYGNRDGGTGNNRLSIIRLTDNGSGGLTVGASSFVTGQVQAALPSVAVTSNGVVGVLYFQFDGVSGGGIPMFSAHLALSENQGASFSDFTLESFLSSATNSGACKQRVLGDYHQVKAVGTTLYGVFTGNGVPFGRPFANHDPIFFKVQTNCTITCPANITTSNDPGQCGAVVNYPPPTAVSCGTVTCLPATGAFFSKGTTTVSCSNTGGTPSCSFTVTVNDTQAPSISCPANIIQSTDPGLCSAVVTYNNATATDNCVGVGTPVCAPASGSIFPKGATTVTCNVSDASGNAASCTFTITVNDTEAPVITCPPDITSVTDQGPCPSPTCQVANFTVTATDNCPGVTVVCKDQNNVVVVSGNCFPIGVTTITCTATDTSSNTATCSFTITTFDAALQDDSNSANILLWNSITGQYRFCCNGITFTGVGKATRQGCVYTLTHNPADRRVLGRVDKAVHSGTASLQAPPGSIRCTITDRNTLNDTLLPSCQ